MRLIHALLCIIYFSVPSVPWRTSGCLCDANRFEWAAANTQSGHNIFITNSGIKITLNDCYFLANGGDGVCECPIRSIGLRARARALLIQGHNLVDHNISWYLKWNIKIIILLLNMHVAFYALLYVYLWLPLVLCLFSFGFFLQLYFSTKYVRIEPKKIWFWARRVKSRLSF